jgi:AcrR family transcriptional regulator
VLTRSHSPTPGLSDRRVAIAEAAIACFNRRGIAETSFGDIAATSGLARSTVYREFRGKAEVLAFLHQMTLRSIELSISKRVTVPLLRDYQAVVEAGARGLLDALSWATFTSGYLVHWPGQAQAYLLNPEPWGVIEQVSGYAAECARRAGATDDPADAARDLVTSLLTRACDSLRSEGAWPGDFPSWPDWVALDSRGFVKVLKLSKSRRPEPMPLPREYFHIEALGLDGLLTAASAATVPARLPGAGPPTRHPDSE